MSSITLPSILRVWRRLRRAGALPAGNETSLVLLSQLSLLALHHQGLLLSTHVRVETARADGGAVHRCDIGEIRAVWCALTRLLEVLLARKTRALCLAGR